MVYCQGKKSFFIYWKGKKYHLKIDKSKGKPIITLIPINKEKE